MNQGREEQVPGEIVALAINCLVSFCRSNGFDIPPGKIAEFAIAWHNLARFEWRPFPTGEIQRIITVNPDFRQNAEAVLVYNKDGFDAEKTATLNNAIRRATKNRWPAAK